MARTEKKFGQANNVPAGTTLTELVPTSANRRNVIINATANASDDVTIVTHTGALSYGAPVSSSSALNPDRNTSGVASGTSQAISYAPLSLSRDSTQIAAILSGTNSIGTWDYNQTTRVVSNEKTNAISWSYNNTFISGGYIGSLPTAGSTPVKYYGIGTRGLFSTLGVSRYYSISSSSSYAQFSHIYGITQAGSLGSSSNYTYAWVNGASENYEVPFAISDEHQYNFSSSNVGVLHVFSYAGNGVYNGYDARITYFTADVSNMYYNSITESYFTGGDSFYNPYQEPWIGTIFPFVYNPTYGIYAVSTSTQYSGNLTLGSGSLGATEVTNIAVTGINSHPGFRIVQNNGSGDYRNKPWTGTTTYPAPPTGVNVPHQGYPIRAMKFSPDYTKLAIFYNRSYSGTGILNSVVVIYTRNSSTGAWEHTHSSGNVITNTAKNQDCAAWSPDGSAIAFVDTSNVFRVFSLGFSGALTGNSVTVQGGYPVLNSGTITGGSVTHVNGLFTNSFNPGTSFSYAPTEVRSISTTADGYRWLVTGSANNGSAITSTSDNAMSSLVARASTTTVLNGVANYVTTVAQSMPLVAGNVTQITGIVLEPGEKLSAQGVTGGRATLSAYGVEIS